jgi:hypothetical protein
MNATQRRRPPVEEPAGGLRSFLSARRSGMGALLVLAGVGTAAWALWTRYATDLRSAPDMVLFPEAVAVSGVAPWVQGDLKTAVLRDASLDGGLPLDDPELPQRLERAFAMHPWVREVVAVTLRHPAAAAVEVRCREPVAMVAVPGGLLAVDAAGVVLPSEDFTAEAAAAYPRVRGIRSSPVGLAGSRWGDAAVHEAAAVAAAVGPECRDMGLRDLRPTESSARRVWELVDASGRVIRFGSAPGEEEPGEPSAAEKVNRLRALATDPDRPEWTDLTVRL